MGYLKGVFVVVALLSTTLCSGSTDLSAIELKYGTDTYDPDGNDQYLSTVDLINTGNEDIDTGSQSVSIHVCLIRLVIGTEAEAGIKIDSSDADITVYHLDGCAHKIVFASPFKLGRKASFSFNMDQKHWSVAYTDVMNNWYIQLGDGDHQLIANTNQDQTMFVYPYDTSVQYMRTSKDLVFPLTGEERYIEYKKEELASEEDIKARLIPDLFESLVDENTDFKSMPTLKVEYTIDATLKEGQFKFEVVEGSSDFATVYIMSDTPKEQEFAKSTLEILLERYDNQLPIGTFTSRAPRFEYRGFMIDISRQFLSKEVIKRQLKLMARYKLNVLHLHLADDESWALEIVDIPELTTAGSKQCFNMDECVAYPQLGRQISGDRVEYLSKADYIDIVQYAESLGITVIPEIESPGHSNAAVQAMKIRRKDNPTGVDYSLDDPEDTSEYLSVQYFTKGAMNPCVDSMFTFMDKVFETLQSYHQEAGQILTILHLGGDEVADGAWTNSPACENLTAGISDQVEKVNIVKIHMLQKLGELAERYQVSLGFWEDGLINKTSKIPFIKDEIFPSSVDVYGYTWQTVWEWWGGDRAFNMANGGYKVVLTPATHYYMDHSQEPHPREHGYYWATRYINLRKAFSFRPINYYANIDGTTIWGLPQSQESWCTTPSKCPPLTKPENIVGLEAPLFGETIQTQDDMDNNVWLRLLAIAERSWNEAGWEKSNTTTTLFQQDFDRFRQVIEEYELPALEKEGVKYHLSPPAVTVKADEDVSKDTYDLHTMTEFEGQRVWWKKSDGSDYEEVSDSEIEYKAGSKIYVKTSNAAGTRFSYEVEHYDGIIKSSSITSVASIYLSMFAVLVCICLNL